MGEPPDDRTAIAELERLREAGARFLVFAWPGFLWLDYYGGFADYVETRSERVGRPTISSCSTWAPPVDELDEREDAPAPPPGLAR